MTAKRSLTVAPEPHSVLLTTESAPVGAPARRFVTHLAEYHHRGRPARLELVSQGAWRHQRKTSDGSAVWDTIGNGSGDLCQPPVSIPRLSTAKPLPNKGNAMHFDDLVDALGTIDQLSGKPRQGHLWSFVREFQTSVTGFPAPMVATRHGEMRGCEQVSWYGYAQAVELWEDNGATDQVALPRTFDAADVPNVGMEAASGRWVTPWGQWYKTRRVALRYEFAYGPLDPLDPAQATASLVARFCVAAGPSGEEWVDWPNLPLSLAYALRQHLWGHATHHVYVHATRSDTSLSVKQLILA